MELLITTLAQVFVWKIVLLSFGGTALGVLFGALPGLGAASGMALLLPVTYFLPATEAQVILLSIYTGAIFGGSWAAILINIPGCAASLMTTLDGYPMARRGEAGRALGLAATCSFIGGMFGIVALIFLAPLLATVALSFAAPEYAMLALLGLSSIVVVSTSSPIKGYLGVTLGILVATVGMDPIVFTPRFTFGSLELMNGIDYIVIIIGVFGIGEVFAQILAPKADTQSLLQSSGRVLPTLADMKCVLRNMFYPCVLGTGIGTLPGAGASIASVISYNRAMHTSKTPERFGTGIPEGLIASETANNATIGGAMVPLLTLGIPGSAATAVLLGALMMHNLQPGPMLFTQHLDIVYFIFSALVLANIFMLVIGLGCAPYVSRILKLPMAILFTIIIVVSITGTYTLHNSLLDVWIMIGAGFAGCLLRWLDISMGGFILGLVLGPIVESNLRRSLEMSSNGPLIFLTRPVSVVILLLVCFTVLYPLIKQWRQQRS